MRKLLCWIRRQRLCRPREQLEELSFVGVHVGIIRLSTIKPLLVVMGQSRNAPSCEGRAR
jgi:hypothetical protein